MHADLRLGLVGAGAVGSLLASALLSSRQSFHWVVRAPQRAAQLADGLAVMIGSRSNAEMSSILPLQGVKVVGSAQDLPALDWLIIAVKAQQVKPALAALSGHAIRQTLVVGNGLHAGPFHFGILNGGAYLAASGQLITTNSNELLVGPLGIDAPAASLSLLLGRLSCEWLLVQAEASITRRMWIKAALNCIVNPLTALLDVPNGEMARYLASPLVRGMLVELSAVINRTNFNSGEGVTAGQLGFALTNLIGRTSGNSSSMREDLRHGRETEIGALNLAVAAFAQEAGLNCPLTAALGKAIADLQVTKP